MLFSQIRLKLLSSLLLLLGFDFFILLALCFLVKLFFFLFYLLLFLLKHFFSRLDFSKPLSLFNTFFILFCFYVGQSL